VRARLYTVIQAMTGESGLQGAPRIDYLCRLAGVSRAGYYRHLEEKAPARADADLRAAIHLIALEHKHYGYRPMTKALKWDGIEVNSKRVRRLMGEDNLLALRKKAFIPKTTDSHHSFRIAPNLIRHLIPTGLDQIWVADITYIRLAEAFAYLAIVLDAFSRRMIGWALEDHLRAELPLAALHMALQTRRPPPNSLIHHSDRGVQYASNEYTKCLEDNAIRPSMSAAGNPYDNAKAESFMKTLKKEEVDARSYPTLQEAKQNIGVFLERTYNRQRLHSALGYRPPATFEVQLLKP
jgi:transposase InsO family protein